MPENGEFKVVNLTTKYTSDY